MVYLCAYWSLNSLKWVPGLYFGWGICFFLLYWSQKKKYDFTVKTELGTQNLDNCLTYLEILLSCIKDIYLLAI
jgi:hypothetical protein